MRIGSLFSGAGGLDLAVEEVFGGEVIWQCEVDKAAAKVLAYRFPCAPNLGDITAVDWKTVEPVDVLCGGFPCQDVSAAGKRAGIKDGTRSGLWAVFADAIDILRPPIVVIENVRGLLSAKAHRNLEPADTVVGDRAGGPVLRAAGAVLGDLADLGYDARWATVSAASVGAPHRRERVFIVAAHSNQVGPEGCGLPNGMGSTLPQPGGGQPSLCGTCGHQQRLHCDHIGRCTKPCECPGFTAADSSRDGRHERRPEPAGLVGGFDAAVGGDADGRVDLLPTPTSRYHKGRNQRDDETCLPGALLPTPNAQDGNGGKAPRGGRDRHNTGTKRQVPLTDLPDLLPTLSPCSPFCVCGGTDAVGHHELLCTPSASDGAGGKTSCSGGRIDEPLLGGQAREMATAWGKYEPAIRRWENLTRPAPAPTEPNKNGNPRLSAAFSEWLMGWPAGWVTDPDIGISRNDQLRIIGNGVCPQQATAALHYLLNVSEVAV